MFLFLTHNEEDNDMKANRGFTLVEILIVVVILGILAAIVVPQFTQASTEAKVSSSLSSLQSLRSQIELYRIQHNDNVPTLADFEDAMTMCSNAALSGDGYVEVEGRDKAVYPYGPYMQILPVNPWNNQRGVAAAGGPTMAGSTIRTPAPCIWTPRASTMRMMPLCWRRLRLAMRLFLKKKRADSTKQD